MPTVADRRWLTTEAEPVGLLTEGAAGIATIVIAIIALAGISPAPLAAIATIVVGVGLMVQAFNDAAERLKPLSAGGAANRFAAELGGQTMVDSACGLAGIVLGILALVGINGHILVSAALLVFGSALLLSGATGSGNAMPATVSATAEAPATGPVASGSMAAGPMSAAPSSATRGMEVLAGFAAIVLGILSLVLATSGVLILVGLIVTGVALLLVSASFSAALVRVSTTS